MDTSEMRGTLNKIKEFSDESFKETLSLLQFVNPAKDAIQVSSQIRELFGDIDWTTFSNNLADPEKTLANLDELTQLQKAIGEKTVKAQKENIARAGEINKEYFEAMQKVGSAKDFLPIYLDNNLRVLKDLKDQASDIASLMSSTNAAYLAWTQQAIQTLARPQ